MGQNVRDWPRRVLSPLQQSVRAVKNLRGSPDGFVGTDQDGFATTTHLASGTPSATVFLRGDGTWATIGAGSITDGDYGDIEVTNSGATWTLEDAANCHWVHNVTELEALIPTLTSGGIVFLQQGTYVLTTTLTFVDPNVMLIGAGSSDEGGGTILRMTDVNTDIISIQATNIVFRGIIFNHGSSLSAGSAVAGTGRGCVVEAQTSAISHVRGCQWIDCSFFNIANWCIFDTGVRAYEVLASPPAGAESPCYGFDNAAGSSLGPYVSATTSGSKTVTSAAQFGSVRVGNIVTGTGIPINTRVVAKASSSSLTISKPATATGGPSLTFAHATGCGESILMDVTNCIFAFPASGGCIYVGAGSTTWRLSGILTNSYSYGSYTSQVTTPITDSVTLGQVHFYSATGHVIDKQSIFQSPADDTVNSDKDATMVSFHQTNSVTLYSPYIEILSSNLTDGNSGVAGGGRQYWLFTSMNCEGLKVQDPIIVSKATLRIAGTLTTTTNIQSTVADDFVNIKVGTPISGGTGSSAIPAAAYVSAKPNNSNITISAAVASAGGPFTFTFGDGFPARIWKTAVDDHVGTELTWTGGEIRNRRVYYDDVGAVATPPVEDGDFVTDWDKDDFVFQAPYDGTNLRPINITDFEVINYDGLGHRPPTIPTSGAGSSMSSRTNFRIQNHRGHRLGVWDDFDASAMTTSVDDIRARTALAYNLRPGIFGACRGLGRVAISGTLTSVTNIQSTVAGDFANIVVGVRVEGNLVATDTYVSAKPDNSNVTLSQAASGTGGPFAYTFYAPGTYQREGLWAVSGLENDVRQIPWIRKHTSAWSAAYAGDLWMRTHGTLNLSVYPSAEFNWYSAGVWNAVFGLPRTTTVAGDLAYYSAQDTPARLAIGNSGDLLTPVAGVPTWKSPVIDGDGNVVTSGGELVFS